MLERQRGGQTQQHKTTFEQEYSAPIGFEMLFEVYEKEITFI